jgi:hypothetical protein
MNLPFLPSPGRNDYPDPEDVKAIEAAFKTLFETIGPITERLFNDQKDFFLLVQAGFAVPGTAIAGSTLSSTRSRPTAAPSLTLCPRTSPNIRNSEPFFAAPWITARN